jgi:chromosome segregation ATPase
MNVLIFGQPDEKTAATLRQLASLIAATTSKVSAMSQEIEDLKREITETQAAVAAATQSVTDVLGLVATLQQQLAAAAANGLSPTEAATMAASLDAPQQELAAGVASISNVTGGAVVPAPAPTPEPPPAQ